MKLLFIILLTFFISGCDLLDSEDIKLKKIESKKELALIQKNKELDKIKLQAEVNQASLRLDKEKEIELFEQNLKLQKQQNELETNRYLMFLAALVIVIISFFIFYYFKKRHENQLKSYEDNLKKYLQQKENDSRNKIAEKLIDTIASGKLDKDQEATLLTALSGQVQQSASKKEEPLLLEDMEAEIEEVKEINK